MNRLFSPVLFLILFWSLCGYTQDLSLAAMFIPDTLKKSADAVIRFHNTEITRHSAEKATMHVHFAVTVLNREGRSDGWLVVNYHKHRTVKSIKSTYYNQFGLEAGKARRKDIEDYAAYPDFTFFSDSRVKCIRPVRDDYPYTAEYEYEIQLNGLVGFDIWMPVRLYGVSLQKASLIYESPEGFSINYKTANAEFGFSREKTKNSEIFTWTLDAVPAYRNEIFMPPKREFLPYVMLSPSYFEYDGTSGNFDSWENYGKWVFQLLQGRDELPEEKQQEIIGLVRNCDKRTAIKKIYRHMQQTTRYVNISLGIGGFQPMSAQEVLETGYGDCKALTNYTHSLLKVAGIESYYAEIGNGKQRAKIYPDFPGINQTNHVILCVPANPDTLWLECTNQNIPCGYTGSGNANRKAVLITENGGRLTDTPKYTSDDNLTTTYVHAQLDKEGNLNCYAHFDYTGLSCERIMKPLYSSRKEQKEWLLQNLDRDQLTINSFSFSDTVTDVFESGLEINATISNFATQTGRRLIFEPNVFNRYISGLSKHTRRDHDIYVSSGYTRIDSINIQLPDSYKVEYLPPADTAICKTGNYYIRFDTSGRNLKVSRKLIILRGKYPKTDYHEIHDFFRGIAVNDTKKIVLTRQK